MYTSYIVVLLVAILSFFIKSATGFGNALVMVPLLTMTVGIRHAIIVAALVDLVGGLILFVRNPVHDSRKFWAPMAAGMVAGSIIGGIVLGFVPVAGFKRVLGGVIVILGGWFMAGRGGRDGSSLPETPPERAAVSDIAVSSFSGFCGGLFGMSGPPIVYHLGRKLAKTAFRSTLIAVFVFAGFARVSTYAVTGLIDADALLMGLSALPGMMIGLYLGHHLFIRIEEIWFARFVGLVLAGSGIRLFLG